MEYSFGNWVKRRRKALDLTQQALAERVGCSMAMIVKIEADERRPSVQIAELLAVQLAIPPDQIPLFLQTARLVRSIDNLDSIPPPPDTPPTPTIEPIHSRIPVSPHPILGRRQEIDVITRQLSEPSTCRLLTLTGPGGVGKTRLSMEVGSRLESHFEDGVSFIPMAGIGISESIIPTIADTLGMTFSGPAAPIAQLTSFLRTKRILLIIDNMEHLLSGRDQLGEILQQTQHLRMLVTSREPLRLQWEWLFEVQGLPVPEDVDADLGHNSAIRLFSERARQASHHFSLESEDTEALVRICKLVDGLPLALELAAAWVRTLSCREIADELERSLDVLETRYVDMPVRHRSMKTVFEHSWSRLPDEEKGLLMRLAIFQGGFTRDAARSVCDATISTLSSLVDKSLLRHSRDTGRYDLHALIHQFALAQLRADASEEQQVAEKFAVYYASWIAALESPFKSAQQSKTSRLIREETANWLGAWHWSVQSLRLDLLRKMSPCLNWYFEVHGFYQEALSAFQAALNMFRSNGAPANLQTCEERSAFAGLVDQVGWFKFRMGDLETGSLFFAESLEIARDCNDAAILYYIYGNWGFLSLMRGDFLEAERLTTESLRYGRILNSPWHIAIPINILGIVSYQKGDLSESHRQLTESLELWRRVGDPRGLVFCMLYLGVTLLALKDMPATRSIFEESNRIAEANTDRWAHAFGLDMLGIVCMSEKDHETSIGYFKKSIALSKEIGDSLGAMESMIHLGQAYAALQCHDDARQLFLDVYASAKSVKWTPIILNVLVAFVEMHTDLPAATRLVVALSVLANPTATSHVRQRCESIRADAMQSLTASEVETVEQQARERHAEDLAQEMLK